MTGLLLSVLSGIDLALLFFILLFYKKICLKEFEVWQKVFETKLFSRLSYKVCHRLSSPVLLHKFTNELQWNHDLMILEYISKSLI